MLLIPELKRHSIIKQLFYLGILFEYITDLKEISQLYKKKFPFHTILYIPIS
jgi:hypothetical protein